jgi:hypothetical protein
MYRKDPLRHTATSTKLKKRRPERFLQSSTFWGGIAALSPSRSERRKPAGNLLPQ